MQTYTHIVMTALLGRQLRPHRDGATGSPSRAVPTSAVVSSSPPLALWGRELPPLAREPLLLGSFMPDVPLTLWTIVYVVMDWLNGARWNPESPGESLVGVLFDDMFFNDPWVKAAHNIFHAPILTVSYMLVGYALWRGASNARPNRSVTGDGVAEDRVTEDGVTGDRVAENWRTRWGEGLFWFGVACTIHTVIDILVHHNDGPLLLFPFEWNLRFMSPVSYWDRDYYGIPFTIFEHALLIVMLVMLARGWWQRRRARREAVVG